MPNPQTQAAPLVVDNLTFKYRSRPEPALTDLSFTLQAGEVLLVAGASGSGKTTLIRCINGLIPRSYSGDLQGEVLLYGVNARTYSLANLAQIVGTVLQDPEKQILGAHVKTEVAFGPENLGLPFDDIQDRVTEALQRLGLEHLRDRETFSLSGGEKQKVALAGALAMRPSILLLDEPLASLDPASAREALATFRRLADEGTTIVMIEHRVEDALAARPDRVLYIKDSRIHYLGPPDDLSEAVDWREVKLPARQAMRLIRAQKKAEGRRMTDAGEVGGVFQPSAFRLPPSKDLPALVRFENVSYHYDEGMPVLHGINLEIRAGERVALLGPNGAGKSTLVKHAIGLLKPRQGRVLIDGKDTRDLSVAQVARTVGYVFQSPGHMLFAPTVKEELGFGPRNIGQSEADIDRNVAEATTDLNLEGLQDYPPLALSFGQQKRVTIACVAAMRSRILALDEPTAGQDFGNYMGFMDSMLGLHGNGAGGGAASASRFDALIFITHDLDLAVIFASRAILMADGRIAADGPPEQVLADSALLERCRIVPTSLLAENLRLLPKTGRFLRIEALAEAAG